MLDALRKSRGSGSKSKTSLFSKISGSDSSSSRPSPAASPSLGNGTVPPLQFPQLVRPVVPAKAAPLGPPDLTRKASDPIITRGAQSLKPTIPQPGSDAARMPPPPIVSSRTPSPDKRGAKFVATLRSTPKDYRAPSGRMVSNLKPQKSRPMVASAAAALAWPNGQPPRASMDEVRNPYVEYLAREGADQRRGGSLDLQRPRMDAPRSMQSGPNQGGNRGQLSTNHSGQQRAFSPPSISQPFAYRNEYPAPTPINPRKILTNNPPQPGLKSPPPPSKPSHLIARKAVAIPPTSPPAELSTSSKQLGHGPEKSQGSFSRVLGSVRGRKNKSDKGPVPAALVERAPAPVSASSQAPLRTVLMEGASGPSSAAASAPGHASTRDTEGRSISSSTATDAWDARVQQLMKNLPRGVDESAAKSIFNEIVIKGDEVHWEDVAGLDIAKNALKEAVVYPFLRPDLFLGLREPARGMLLFGPPGTGKTMLARAVATESRSTFFAISASSLTSKFLGESEKLVRALFTLAKALAPSIIFVDEIDSLLSSRSGSGEHEATRRIKTEFLIQWSDLAKAAAGKEQSEKEKAEGDATRVLVLAATNLPWAIDEAARRRFVRRQYIPLPESHVRDSQLRRLLAAQKHNLKDKDMKKLITLTDGKSFTFSLACPEANKRLTSGFSGSDITALAKDAAMGPLRSLGEKLLHMSPDEIRPIGMQDFEASLVTIRPSVSKQGLKQFEDWAKEFGERGG